jgi:hypothetical protein
MKETNKIKNMYSNDSSPVLQPTSAGAVKQVSVPPQSKISHYNAETSQPKTRFPGNQSIESVLQGRTTSNWGSLQDFLCNNNQ